MYVYVYAIYSALHMLEGIYMCIFVRLNYLFIRMRVYVLVDIVTILCIYKCV